MLNGGAIFSQGILITNNCTFLNNNAYSNGLDICIGDGGILVMDNKNITSANATGAVCFAKSLTGTASTWIKVGSYVASFVVNKYTNEISKIDVLYSVNAKKESAALLL